LLVAELLGELERLAPGHLSQPWDNSGLLVGDESQEVHEILVALEVTADLLDEAVADGCDTILTHHPLLFSPVRSLVEGNGRQRLLRVLVLREINLISCHTNLDAAPGGLADIAGEALGLDGMVPIEPAAAGWFKFVGFIPREAVDTVAAAVFAAGAGGIGNYSECAFAAEGTGWFTPGSDSRPVVGEISRPERTPEVRWETVVPKVRLAAAVRAFVAAHPYEEPAFDLYEVEDVLPGVGLGRVGTLAQETSVEGLAEWAAQTYECEGVAWSGEGDARVRRVGVLPGSGSKAIETAAGLCEALITGDVTYHDGEKAAEMGMALIDVPHGDLEWWALKRWAQGLKADLAPSHVGVTVSERWRPCWRYVGAKSEPKGSRSG